ncbi:hypothetical protein [Stygiolobus caldivivus]|uniref:Uncharacterized protein n=1 Tax=Stygiolobus caldivivus TaxID=2824673 RepID=A0A8D5ZKI8_9CREN|nr:hypothetical protein [Stygiolobus caldivivus]BCU71430.1 hypothetical protein KN1_27270 [Stygiolobus caldivivus]
MQLQNVDVSSIISPEVRYITLTSEFIPYLAEEVPVFTSYNQDKIKLRKLILLSEKLRKKIVTGYRYDVEVKEGDGGLTSLYDMDSIVLTINAKKHSQYITTSLIFTGIKSEKLEKVLILYDIPIVSTNREDLIMQITTYLKSYYGIEIDRIPTKFRIDHKHIIKAKLVDVDYAFTLFTVQ